ncbi:hypothetical protein H4S02_010633 [Coemansia sp. RSA 2611]|nr:hypothetical protein H4S02_010633 [Coemansia sp. RSA 2611]
MFTTLEDALKKLREVRQTGSSQPKRHAVAEAPPDPPENDTASADFDGPEFDLGDADVFDDLLVGDMDMGNEPPSAAQPQSLPVKPTATSVVTPAAASKSVSRLAAFTFAKSAKRDAEEQQQYSTALQNTSEPQQVSSSPKPSKSQPPKVPSEQINSAKRGLSSADQQHQKIPGPAGLTGAPVADATVPTQKPASTFQTVLERLVKSEQPTDMDFESGTWAAMIDYLGMPSYRPLTASVVTRTEERAMWPICRVLKLTRTQKVPSMLVQIRDITSSEHDASAVIADPTGELRASIHSTVLRRVTIPLVAGTSIILSDVAAMKIPGWLPFIVITGGMIEQMFTVESAGTREDPIVVEDTQKGSVLASTLAPRAATASGSGGPMDTQATQNTDLCTAVATQSAVDLGGDELDGMPEETDDMLGLLNDEPFFSDDDEVILSQF